MTISGPKGLIFEEEKEMPNKCPNCARDFGIEEIGKANIFWDELKIVYVRHIGYRCKCGSHWTRPKEEVENET